MLTIHLGYLVFYKIKLNDDKRKYNEQFEKDGYVNPASLEKGWTIAVAVGYW